MDRIAPIALRSGRKMPPLGLGTRELVNDTEECVARAIEAGYRLIDTARGYGNQRGIGAAIVATGLPREEVFLVTTVRETDDPVAGVLRDLGEMGLGHADLALIRRPRGDRVGADLWGGLAQARAEGLVREIGVSDGRAAEIDRLAAATGEMPAVNQVEWTPFGHDYALLAHHRENGIVLMAHTPLTRGERLGDPTLVGIARRHGRTPAQVLIRWNLERGTVPVPKANRMDHAHENLDVVDFALDDGDLRRLDALEAGWSAAGDPGRAERR